MVVRAGSFHLLRLLLDEYVLLLLERALTEDLVRQLLANVARDAAPLVFPEVGLTGHCVGEASGRGNWFPEMSCTGPFLKVQGYAQDTHGLHEEDLHDGTIQPCDSREVYIVTPTVEKYVHGHKPVQLHISHAQNESAGTRAV